MENKDSIGLYLVQDIVSHKRLTGIITCVNSGVAINGFINFVNEEVQKGLSPKMYRLLFVGDLTGDGEIVNTRDTKEICNGENMNEVFDQWKIEALEEEND